MASARTPSLSPLLTPRSVAIVGAFARPGSIGRKTIDNLRKLGWPGRLYLVHPSESEVAGHRCVRALADLPEAPDCVVVAVSAARVPGVLREVAARGTRAAVVHAGGFAEAGRDGEKLQLEVAGICRATGLAVCGPNSIGLVNVNSGAALYGAPLPEGLTGGGVSIVSQSGSACILLTSTARFGFSHIISSGNEAVVGLDGYISYLADDLSTKVIACYIESVRDPDAFAAAADRAAKVGKAVVALRVGRSSRAHRISAAHTGSLAGDNLVYADFFRSCSVLQVNDFDELTESLALMLDVRPVPSGARAAIVNISGGENVLTADLADEVGLPLADLAQGTRDALSADADGAWVANPVDAGAVMFNMPVYRNWLNVLLADPGVGVLAIAQDMPLGLGTQEAEIYRSLSGQIADVARASAKPVLCYSNVAAGLHPHVTEPLRLASVPVLQGARASLAALAGLIALRDAERDADGPGSSRTSPSSHERIQRIPAWTERLSDRAVLTDREAKSFLADHGILVTQPTPARSAEEASAVANRIGYPVVMKIDAPGLSHKSDVRGVSVDLRDAAAVRRAFDVISRDVDRLAPGASVQGVLLEPFVAGGVEVIVGLVRRKPFGTALLIGVGGVLAELVNDAAIALLPVGRIRAGQLIDQTRAAVLLDGFRGRARADRAALIDLVLRVAALGEAYGDRIAELDLNPVAVLQDGHGAVVLDAMIAPQSRTDGEPDGL